MAVSEGEYNTEMRLVVFGHTGDGKSSTCNSIMMKKGTFKASGFMRSETEICSFKKKIIQDVPLLLVDTPGLFDTRLDADDEHGEAKRFSNKHILEEIKRCLMLSAPGPHAFLYVVKIGTKFSAEYKDTLKLIRDCFGSDCNKFMMVVFCGADNLGQDDDDCDTLAKYLKKAPREICQLVADCGGRYVGFNNRCKKDSDENKEQVRAMLDVVGDILKLNETSYYSSDQLKEAERVMQEKDEELRKQINQEMQEKLAEMNASLEENYDEKVKALRKEHDRKLKEVRDRNRRDVEEPGFFGRVGNSLDFFFSRFKFNDIFGKHMK